jgi:hypothetical protein
VFGADQEMQRQDEGPKIPPLRAFKVRRFDPLAPAGGDPRVEEVNVSAHEVQNQGPVLQFIEFRVTPQGPCGYVARAFYGWIDYEEVATVNTSRFAVQ